MPAENVNDEYMRLVSLNSQLTDELREVRARMAKFNPGTRGSYRIAIRPDVHGGDPMSADTLLDDIVVNDVPMFRAEQMDTTVWWVCCYLDNDTHDRITWDVRARSKPLRLEWTAIEYPEVATYEHDLRRP